MELIARLTKDAIVKNVKDDKKVVEFTVVENYSYTPKGGERVEIPTFFKCSYWLSDKIAEHLTKGSDVKLTGRVDMNVYKNMEGEAQGSLILHVNSIRIIHKVKSSDASKPTESKTKSRSKKKEDLPF